MILPAPPMPRWPAASPEGIAAAARALLAGGVILAPTESSYCVAASPSRDEALAGVRAVKSREAAGSKPLLLLCASLEQARSLGHFEGRALALAAHWPAPLTIIVAPLDDSLAKALGASGLALRVPACEPARALAALAGPYTGTSANRPGEPPIVDPSVADARRASDPALAAAHPALAGILDAGILPGGPPSTLVEARGANLIIVRQGAFPTDHLPPR